MSSTTNKYCEVNVKKKNSLIFLIVFNLGAVQIKYVYLKTLIFVGEFYSTQYVEKLLEWNIFYKNILSLFYSELFFLQC